MAALAAAAREVSLDQSRQLKSARPLSQSEAVSKASLLGSSASNRNSGALIDGPSLSTMLGAERAGSSKPRVRRASEGSRLSRGERRRSTVGELRCDKCGKSYKHGSCLTKHLWEHTPEWNLTSKLLISKHQQVQLLEAASVLVGMNNDGTTKDTESAIQVDSDLSSDSPHLSGSSERHDDDTSSRTSTPSQEDDMPGQSKAARMRPPKRQDSYSSVYSYTTPAVARRASGNPYDTADSSYYRRYSYERRPSTAGMSSTGSQYDSEEQADVTAAAEGLLSCSLGTPNHSSSRLPPDVPPVPPVPAKFAKQMSPLQGSRYGDLEMTDARPLSSTITATRIPEDDEDEGVFGHMEQ
ncbi:MAG: hypothetical protein M1828_004957 [Chrysothrix sp. TS-e1954]|nr:MAG: hypothetical protein M1828_004957 [Chrysothrix sp. TS-e1954]